MEFYTDIEKARSLIEESIQKFGYAPEHNTEYYIYCGADHAQTIFVRFFDGGALLGRKDPGEWDILSEPVAPPERRAAILAEFLVEALKDSAIKKVNLELYYQTRHDLLKRLPGHLRARSINYTLTWPVFDLVKFDPEFPGGRYKDLRNARSKFYREHKVEMRSPTDVPRVTLHAIVDAWKKNRHQTDRAYSKMYHAMIDGDFNGTTSARIFEVDGHVAGVNAGWKIPHSGGYYASIGLHDYSIRDMGDVMYMEDLAFLKQAGYTYADFGGTEKITTLYKLKFGEAALYKSFVFSVVRK